MPSRTYARRIVIVPEPDRALILKAVTDRGLDLEELREDDRAATWLVTVVVDGDSGVTLDDLAELSTDLDPLAAQWGGEIRPVTLEVTSRGVDAPLEAPRHWRRARGRQVDLVLADGVSGPARARVGDLDEARGTIRLVEKSTRGLSVVSVALTDVVSAVIRVEFKPAPAGELDLLSEPGETGHGTHEGVDR